MEKVTFIYDKDVDSLAVFTGRKTYASMEFGKEIIIGLDRHNQVTGVEILNPDKLFNIPKKLLSSITSASMKFTRWKGMLQILILLKTNQTQKEIPILIPA
jgi:uncharacterized protein YuzE